MTRAAQPLVDPENSFTPWKAFSPDQQDQEQTHLASMLSPTVMQAHSIHFMSSLVAAFLSTWKRSWGQYSGEEASHISVSQCPRLSPEQEANLPRNQFRWVDGEISTSSTIFQPKVCFGYCSKQDLSIWEPHWYKLFQTPSGTELVSAPDRRS